MNRRTFLERSALLAGAFCLDVELFAKKIKNFGAPRLKAGVLSDIHIYNLKSTETFEHTLLYFREQKVNAVIIAGDIADCGFESQMALASQVWYKVFPNDEGADGKKVEKLFVFGNHDIEGHNYGSAKRLNPDEASRMREKIEGRRSDLWEKYWHEPYEDIWLKEVNGYCFIGGQYQNRNNMPGLDAFLKKNDSVLRKDGKPFFYIQHTHPKDTCSSPYVWGQDNGEVTQLLSEYPQAIAFSGHSHYPLTDERTIWQGAFTSIGTASLSYVYPIGARENSEVYKVPEKIPAQMSVMDYYEGRHGMLMTVYSDNITIERREFVYDELLGDPWIIPLPFKPLKSIPFSYEHRARLAEIPQFPIHSQVRVEKKMGKNRKKEEIEQYHVYFPTVLKKNTGVRAFDYEVTAEIQDEDVIKIVATKRVFSPGSILGESHDEKEALCAFALSEIPAKSKVRFAVRPCECFGKKGNPIYSDWIG